MMKRISILFFLMACILSGCGKTDTATEQWYRAVDSLKQQENYTVEEITITPEETIRRYRQYDLTRSRTEEPDEILYFCVEDGVCYGLGWAEDPGVWVKKEIEYGDLYFYDYTLLDRLNRLSGLIDMGLLTYQESDNTYTAHDLNSKYVYRDLEHTPLELKITVENSRITKIHEVWQCSKDGKELGRYEDYIEITDMSTTQIRLPSDVIEVDADEEAENEDGGIDDGTIDS